MAKCHIFQKEFVSLHSSIAESTVNGACLAREAQESLSAGWQYDF